MIKAKKCLIRGTVQGVGFRPWVYRLALQYHLKGFVRNTSHGATIEIEGEDRDLQDFVRLIRSEPPAHCHFTKCHFTNIACQGFDQFLILPSLDENQHDALILPDIASCPDCIKETFDRNDRRYLYPFTNCTHCGPRYSIIKSLPYDRCNTSMDKFKMCKACQKEYDDPLDRRFHAQPNACPLCGPQITLWDDQGNAIASSRESLPATVDIIKRGGIVAIKGLGGFCLMADALNEDAVGLLRMRKARPHKPLALMMPSLEMTDQYCQLEPIEAELLSSSQAPIVLLRKAPLSQTPKIARQAAPDNPYLGCMLPSMPLLHILLRMLNRPVVATSGNLSEEPICIDNAQALKRLKGIADFFLVHDRPIVRHVDDSIVQAVCNKTSILRRARGYAPLPFDIGKDCDGILATGAHQKNTVALGLGSSVIMSQHIGTLDNEVSCQAFEGTISSLKSIYDAPTTKVACDSHPDYASNRYAHAFKKNVLEVQHHHAHVASCMAEHGLSQEVLGVCWDGTGYGPDGTIWGGEFLVTNGRKFSRIAHLKLFALPGGELAVREPKRTALGLLFGLCKGNWQDFKDLPSVKAFNPKELLIIQQMITQKINSPLTSSMGRLFDGIASLTGLCHHISYEGQAAMALEYQVIDKFKLDPYYYEIIPEDYKLKIQSIDWSGIVRGIIDDIRAGENVGLISTRFHLTLVGMIVDIAYQANKPDVVLTGGCFQNKWLVENAVKRLKEEGFKPHWHSQVPTNDGGISLGQMFVAAKRRK